MRLFRMSILPAEVLINVLQHIHLLEKIECLRVCKRWRRVLKLGYLYQVIPTVSQLGCVMKSIKESDSLGRKCKRLILDGLSFEKVDINQLILSCPNLHHLEIQRTVLYQPIVIAPVWKDHLETIIDNSSTGLLVPKLLDDNVFTKTRTIPLAIRNYSQI
jgi:hypothetical protein